MDYGKTRLIERTVLTAVPALFSIIILHIISGLAITSGILDFPLGTSFTYAALALSAVIFCAAQDFFITPKTRLAPHIAILLSCTALMLVLCAAFDQMDAPYALIPGMAALYVLCARMTSLLRPKERFLDCIDGLDGEALRVCLLHNSLVASDFSRCLRKLQATFFALGFVMFTAILGARLAGIRLRPQIIILILVFYAGIFVCGIMLGLYNRRIFYACLGFAALPPKKDGLARFSAAILLACALLALAASSDSALIKIRRLEEKQREIISTEKPAATESAAEYQPQDFGRRISETGRKNPANPRVLWRIIDTAAKAVILAAAAMLAAYGIHRMISSRPVREFFRGRMLAKFIAKLLSDIKDFLRILFHHTRHGGKEVYATVQSKNPKGAGRGIIKKGRKNQRKKSGLDRLTRQFMTLVDWGSRRKIEYKASMAPGEYTQRIKEYLDANDRRSRSHFAVTAGNLFEKALYGKDSLSAAEESDFLSAVRSITSFTIQQADDL